MEPSSSVPGGSKDFGRDVALRQLLRPLAPFLAAAEVKELAVNRPGEVWTQGKDGWTRHEAAHLTAQHLDSLTRALAVFNGLPVGGVLSVILPDGERGQVVREPACVQGWTPFVIRKHSPATWSLKELAERGAFVETRDVSFRKPPTEEAEALSAAAGPRRLEDIELELLSLKRAGDYETFCRRAVLQRRNIVIAGKTFSGKTTFARALVAEIPAKERVITIEDVHEMELPNLNRVPLLFGEGEGRVSAEECLAACMRLSPDRIFLAELRGGEAWEYLMGLNTGHPGSVTTTHSNSAVQTFDRLASLVKNSEAGRNLERAEVRRELFATLDVVLYMADWKVTEVFYDPVFQREHLV